MKIDVADNSDQIKGLQGVKVIHKKCGNEVLILSLIQIYKICNTWTIPANVNFSQNIDALFTHKLYFCFCFFFSNHCIEVDCSEKMRWKVSFTANMKKHFEQASFWKKIWLMLKSICTFVDIMKEKQRPSCISSEANQSKHFFALVLLIAEHILICGI